MSCGLYAARSQLKVVMIEQLIHGGQASTTERIDNYPGFPDGAGGQELMDLFKAHAQKYGMEYRSGRVTGISADGPWRLVHLGNDTILTKTVAISSGSRPNKLNVPGEDVPNLAGDIATRPGVSYCATCDGPFFKDEVLAVVGGGDTALEESDYLTRFATKLHLIHRRDEFRGGPIFQDMVHKNPKIQCVMESVIEEVQGETAAENLVVKNVKTGDITNLPVGGLFVLIGATPNTEYLQGTLDLLPSGHVKTEKGYETSMPGVFACGDCRDAVYKQVVTSAGEGAAVAIDAVKYIAETTILDRTVWPKSSESEGVK